MLSCWANTVLLISNICASNRASYWISCTLRQSTSLQRTVNLIKTMKKFYKSQPSENEQPNQKQRLKNWPSGKVYLQVLGSGAEGAGRCLYVFTDHRKYIFNCGEACQRVAFEHKIKLGKSEHVLITHKSWENVGGLPGMLLTLQDAGVPNIHLHGPPGLELFCDDTRNFICFNKLTLHSNKCTSVSSVTDGKSNSLTITSVPIWGKVHAADEVGDLNEILADDEEEDYYNYMSDGQKGKRSLFPYQSKDCKKQKLEESVRCRNLAIAYICRTPPKSGHLLLNQCVLAGVPPGPLLGVLKGGNDITLPNGDVVKAKDVTEPGSPGIVFIVVEAPSVDYLDSLLENPQFHPHQQETATDEKDLARIVVHFTPPDVVTHAKYQEWMRRFPLQTEHMYINSWNKCLGSEAVHRMQHKLNILSPRLFPLLADSSIPDESERVVQNGSGPLSVDLQEGDEIMTNDLAGGRDTTCEVVSSSVEQNILSTLDIVHVGAKVEQKRSSSLFLHKEEYVKSCLDDCIFMEQYKKAKATLQELSQLNPCQDYPNLVFLGTGASVPSKTRNSSGILLNVSPSACLLMDCGEGTYGQMVRLYGSDRANEALCQLIAIYISHLHADHHIGLIRLLLKRKAALAKLGMHKVPRLLLLAPPGIMNYLSSYSCNFEPTLLDQFQLVSNVAFFPDRHSEAGSAYRGVCDALGMRTVETSFARHCSYSFCVAFTHADGWKIAYSGDTMPCDGLVTIGKECDVLIHEATVEDFLAEDACAHRHSTVAQAVEVGVRTGAKHVLLTHFSPRYSKIPVLSDDRPPNVAVAFDNMQVSLSDLPSLEVLYPAFVAMFAEYYEEMIERTNKKRMARELRKKEMEAACKS